MSTESTASRGRDISREEYKLRQSAVRLDASPVDPMEDARQNRLACMDVALEIRYAGLRLARNQIMGWPENISIAPPRAPEVSIPC